MKPEDFQLLQVEMPNGADANYTVGWILTKLKTVLSWATFRLSLYSMVLRTI